MFLEIPPIVEEFTCNFLVMWLTLKSSSSSSSSSKQRQAGDYARLVSDCLLVTVNRHKTDVGRERQRSKREREIAKEDSV